MTEQRFDFDFHPRFRRLLALAMIRPSNSWVAIDEERFEARFGLLRLRTPVSNLADVKITRDYVAIKALGPRGSLVDHGATFGSTTRGGVCVCFHEPVTALAGPLMRHPALTVTVEDLEGLAAAVRGRIDAAGSAG